MTVATAPLPRRCQEHRDHQRGCPTCMDYGRARVARRSRLIAYGHWQPARKVDATPTYEHIHRLHAAGMEWKQMARLSGVSAWSVLRISQARNSRIWETTANRLLALRFNVSQVPAAGATRRLQALARAGYGIPDLQPTFLRVRVATIAVCRLYPLRSGKHLLLDQSFHLSVARMYEDLWDTVGPCARTMVVAANREWLPFEAWTDATIDDPDAQPYSDPEAAEYVDLERVRRARLELGRAGRIPLIELTYPEQRTVFQQELAGWEGKAASTIARRFRDAYRPVPSKLLRRLMQEAGIWESGA